MFDRRETSSCICSSIHPQISLVRSKFIEALQNYQQVERQYRARYRQRVERQFKIGELMFRPARLILLAIHSH
jgi:t-SNARE complex subunit (syntaxin)